MVGLTPEEKKKFSPLNTLSGPRAELDFFIEHKKSLTSVGIRISDLPARSIIAIPFWLPEIECYINLAELNSNCNWAGVTVETG